MKAYDKLLESILNEYQIVRFTETNYIFEDGSKITRQKFRDEVFPKDMGKVGADVYKLDPEFYEVMGASSAENRRVIKHRFFSELEDIVKKASSTGNNVNSLPEELADKINIITTKMDYSNYRLFRHIANDRYKGCDVLYDIREGCISKISPEAYLDSLKVDEKAGFKPLDAVFEYDPYNISPVRPIEFEGQTINRVNTYSPPDWRKLDADYSETPPKIFSLFLKHLFPDVESRRFVLSWMRNAILNRSETVLILNGAKGTGKNVFADFLKVLVGSENFGRAKTSLIRKEFNSMLEDKRLIFFDEIKIDKKGHTFLKDACNNEHNIEKKGKDANNLTPTYYSILACNNDTTDIYLEPDDRRFSTPNITSTPLKEVMSEGDRKELIDLQKDPIAIKEIGEYIINYKHDAYSDPFYAFMPEKFHQLVFTSLHGWQQHLFDKIANSINKPLDLSNIREDANENRMLFPHTNSKIENFLQNYHHRGLFRVGYLEKEGEGTRKKTMLYATEDFRKFIEETAIGEGDI